MLLYNRICIWTMKNGSRKQNPSYQSKGQELQVWWRWISWRSRALALLMDLKHMHIRSSSSWKLWWFFRRSLATSVKIMLMMKCFSLSLSRAMRTRDLSSSTAPHKRRTRQPTVLSSSFRTIVLERTSSSGAIRAASLESQWEQRQQQPQLRRRPIRERDLRQR